MIHDFLSSDLAWRLGWTLLHSLWQILLIWAAVAFALALFARRSANTRYLIACCGMAAMYVPLAVTYLFVPPRPVADIASPPVLATEALYGLPVEQTKFEPPHTPRALSPSSHSAAPPTEPVDAAAPTPPLDAPLSLSALAAVVSPWLPWMVGTWIVGVGLFALWNVGGWVVVQRLRNRAILPVAQHAQQRLGHFVERLRINRPVRLVGSLLVETPTVIGWLRPVILLPASLVTNLTPAELDAILAHELAHIRRHDYLVNLLQAFTETVLFYHPAVWLISRRIRVEREFCCDDAAIAACGSKSEYVRALAAIEQGRAAPVLAMSFLGGNTNMTLNRIRRILGRSPSTRHAWLACAGALLVPLLIVALVGTALTQTGLVAAPDDSARGASSDSRGETQAQSAPGDNRGDLKQFRLILTYHGESDKPFYNLTLSVPPLAVQQSPTNLFVPIDEVQAAPIAKWLSASGFFKHARVTETQDDPKTGPQYLMRVRIGDKHYEETLGWDIGTIARLDWLRKTLDGEAAKSMDILLGRLAGQRKAWESGEAVNGLTTLLTTRISEETNTFASGRSVPVEVHIKNVSSEDRQYSQVQMHGSDFTVTNEHGRRVPLLGGYVGRPTRQTTIKPGETILLGTLDLSTDYYLRRPGRYSVSYRGYGMPPSNSFSFSVASDAAGNADGDPAGRLLPFESANWTLLGSANPSQKIRPGRNRSEVPGWQFQFVDPAKGIKMSKAIVWLWLTDKAAEEVPPPANDYLPVSESLGKVSKWNAYLQASPEALKLWPTVREDLKKALENEPKLTSKGPGDTATSDDDYRALHDRYKSLILASAKAGNKDEISKLTDQFDASIGGKLLFVQVVRRVGPIATHETLFSKFFDDRRRVSPGKLHFAVSDKPIVSQNHLGQECVLIATNPLEGNKWPDDLQVMLLLDPVEGEVIRKAAPTAPNQAGKRPPPLTSPQWGDAKDGLRSRLSAAKQTFEAGEPIPMTLEVENVGQEAKDYPISVTPAEDAVLVVDERGQTAHQLSPLYRVSVGPDRFEKLKPGEALKLASFDLSESYYLRKPGRYTASWPGKPASASFEFEVAPNPARAAADGDPAGRLLPLMKKGWWFGAGPRGIKFQPGRNWSEGTGRILTFVHNPPSYRDDAGHIWLSLMDEALAALPPATESSKPEAEYLGKIARWHIYYVASGSALKAWPTALEDIKQALTAEFKGSLEVNLDRTEFGVGETVAPSLTIRNLGKADIKAPETFWSANVILDGKVYQRVAQDPWSGAGIVAPGSAYEGSVRLSEHEFGIKPAVLGPGEHKLAMNIGNERSKEVTFTIRAEKPKVSLKIESDQVKYLPGENVVVMVTIGNLGPTNIEAPATCWSARIILDGKEYTRLPKFVGDWNGPAFIIPDGVYRGAVSLTEYGVDPSTLKSGDHKLSIKIGNDVSNELTFSIQADNRDTADQERAAALVTKQLADIAALKPGGSREDFLRLFQEEGGLSNRTQRRYAYRANPNIKVDVTFEAVGTPAEKLAESPKDKVLSISKPFVELSISDTLTRAVSGDKRKLQITIAGPADRVVPPTGDVQLTITLRNLHTERVSIPWVNGNTRVILDGKDAGPLGFTIDRGPAGLDPQQEFSTTQTLALGKLGTGDHTLALQIRGELSNKLTFTIGAADPAVAAPARGQVQSLQAPRFGVQRIDPSMRESKIWLDLKDRLESSEMKYRWVEVTDKGECRMNLSATPTSDLSPLKGAPLSYLDASHTAVKDLSPLEGMPLTVLDLSGSQVESLAPLKGIKLTMLAISGTGVSDLSPLTEAKLTQFTATNTAIADLSPLAEMPLEYLDIRSTDATDLSPLVKTPLSVLQIEGCKVKDLTPLRKTPLRTLTLTAFDGVDLSQLQGTRLTKMTLSGKEIKDLAPLRGMKFESLRIVETSVTDIRALEGMPLTELDLRNSPVSDLAPLKGMKLVSLYVSEPGTDLAPLADMPLETISIPAGADVKNIGVLRDSKTLKTIRSAGKPIPVADFWRRYDAGEFGKAT